MKAFKISHLSLGFAIMFAAFAFALGSYMLYELNGITRAVKDREYQAAREEIHDALAGLNAEIVAVAARLANWDETRQQLVYNEYYILWRDERVKDAGIVTQDIQAVALYDPRGRILAAPTSFRPMPTQLNGIDQPVFVVDRTNAAGQTRVAFFRPIVLDTTNQVLGYLGLGFELPRALTEFRPLRFANISGLDPHSAPQQVATLTTLADAVRFALRPNPSRDFVHEVFQRELVRILMLVIGIFSLTSLVLYRFVIRPLLAITRQIGAPQEKVADRRQEQPEAPTILVQELETVRRSVGNYQSRLAEMHADLEQSNRDFREQSRLDALTGVFNRQALEEDWQASGMASCGESCALILFDCDHFKAINDTYGHAIGDAVIKAIAQCLAASLRTGDHLYRLGGDEFVSYLPNADQQATQGVAERCLERVRQFDFAQFGLTEPVSLSIGFAVVDPSQSDGSWSNLQRFADLAMYESKRPGSNRIVSYDERMLESSALVANQHINAVFTAIRDPALFDMHAQPIVQLPERRLSYSESLARIRSEGRLFAPGEFFPIVHSRRLDAEFDLAIIQAIGLLLRHPRGIPGDGISINVSAPGIVHAGVIAALLKLCQALGTRKCVVEVTETTLITQMDTASAHLRQLRQAGILIALDDFGSGYSSLRYLASMPVDIVKFDISLVRLLEHPEPQFRRITQEIAAMVKTAGYQIVAEGVETEGMLNRVIDAGFDYAQGFLFGRPKSMRG